MHVSCAQKKHPRLGHGMHVEYEKQVLEINLMVVVSYCCYELMCGDTVIRVPGLSLMHVVCCSALISIPPHLHAYCIIAS